MTDNPAIPARCGNKRQMQRHLLPIQVFIYGVFTPAVLFAHPVRNSAKAYALAIFLSVTMVATILRLGFLTVQRTDEYQRLLLTRAMLWGICGTLSITTVSGLLELFTDLPQLPVLASFPIFLAITMTAKAVIFRRDRAVDE
jgi:hypothetical protein